MSNIRLRKSSTNKMITGVCGGIGETFDIDPVLVRLGWCLLTIFAGSGLLLYIIASVIIPYDYDLEDEAVDGTYSKEDTEE